MESQVPAVTQLPDALQILEIPAGACAPVDCVFHLHQAGECPVRVIRIVDMLFYILCSKGAVYSVNEGNGSARIKCHTTTFKQVDVGHPAADDLIAGPCVCLDGYLVGHGSRRTEKGSLHAKHFRCHPFKLIDFRVFAEDHITDTGLHHPFEHSG